MSTIRQSGFTAEQNARLIKIASERAEFERTQAKLVEAAKHAATGAAEDEMPKEVQNLADQLMGIPQREIEKIFRNKFRPMNLYELRFIKGREDMYQYEIYVENRVVKVRREAGSFKDYGEDSEIWSEAFLNYAVILVALFGVSNPTLHFALYSFHRDVIDLSKIYQWQGSVLPMALDFHTHIVQGDPADPGRWEIPARWQARYCNPLTVLRANSDNSGRKRRRAASASA